MKNNWLYFTNLSLTSNWLIFILLLIIIAITAVLIPKFIISFLGAKNKHNVLLSVFLLSFITSIPELLTTFLLPFWSNSQDDGILKSFSNVLGSNILIGSFFCFVFLLFFYKLKTHNYLSELKKITIFGVLISFVVFLILLLPNSYLVFRKNKITIISLIFVILYWLFVLSNFIQMTKQKTLEVKELKINLFKHQKQKKILFIWAIMLITILVSAILVLIRLSEHLQTKYQFSNQVIGSLFFAVANATPEMWTASSLIYYGFFSSALGVIVGSYLLNFVIFFAMELSTKKEIWSSLLNNQFEEKLIWICFVVGLSLLLCQFKIFQKELKNYGLIPILIIGSYSSFIFI